MKPDTSQGFMNTGQIQISLCLHDTVITVLLQESLVPTANWLGTKACGGQAELLCTPLTKRALRDWVPSCSGNAALGAFHECVSNHPADLEHTAILTWPQRLISFMFFWNKKVHVSVECISRQAKHSPTTEGNHTQNWGALWGRSWSTEAPWSLSWQLKSSQPPWVGEHLPQGPYIHPWVSTEAHLILTWTVCILSPSYLRKQVETGKHSSQVYKGKLEMYARIHRNNRV